MKGFLLCLLFLSFVDSVFLILRTFHSYSVTDFEVPFFENRRRVYYRCCMSRGKISTIKPIRSAVQRSTIAQINVGGYEYSFKNYKVIYNN